MDEAPEPLRPRRRGVRSAPQDLEATAVVPVVPVVATAVTAAHERPPYDDDPTADRRRILWRDSATILIGVILALLAYQTLVPGGVGGPTGSETPIPSGVSIGTLPPPVSLPPGLTFGPIVDPSLGVDATPTPIPVITLGPPTPTPSAEPSATRKPTPRPSTTPAPPSVPPDPSPAQSAPPSVPPDPSPAQSNPPATGPASTAA